MNAKYGKRMAMSDNYMAVPNQNMILEIKLTVDYAQPEEYIFIKRGNTFPVIMQYLTTLVIKLKLVQTI